METIVYLASSLLLTVVAFYLVRTNKFPFLRVPLLIMLYPSAAVVSVLLLRFLGVSYKWTATDLFSLLGKLCFAAWVIAGFSVWLYLRHENLSKATKSICGFVTVFVLGVIVLISITSFGVKVTAADIASDNESVTTSITQADIFSKVEPNVIIGKGGSLCGSLGITKQYALQFAKINHLKYHHHGDKLIVLVQSGDEFMPVGKLWIPIKKVKK